MEEMDGVSPQDPSQNAMVTCDYDETRSLSSLQGDDFGREQGRAGSSIVPVTANRQSDDSSVENMLMPPFDDDALWNLVREYKQVKERQRELLNNISDVSSDSSLSEISDKSLIEQQLKDLGELDTGTNQLTENVLIPILNSASGASIKPDDRMAAIAPPVPQLSERPGVPAVLAFKQVSRMNQYELTQSIRELTGVLQEEHQGKALSTPVATDMVEMDTSTIEETC